MVISERHAMWFVVLVVQIAILFGAAAWGDAPREGSSAQDSRKLRLARERVLLMRTIEELNLSLESVMQTTAVLEEQAHDANVLVPEGTGSQLRDIREWYRNYTEWLGRMLAEFENDLAEHYSRSKADRGWTGRYGELTKGYQGLATQLSGTVREIEGAQGEIGARTQKLRQFVRERRFPVEKDNLELLKNLLETSLHDKRETEYVDLTDDEVAWIKQELSILDERQKYLEILAEVGRYELGWLTLKSGESAALDAVAGVIGGDEQDPIRDACRNLVKRYESDIAKLETKVAVIHEKHHGIKRTGTMKMLDLLEELSRHYEKLMTRFEHHIDWLKGQIGSYKADIVELERKY